MFTGIYRGKYIGIFCNIKKKGETPYFLCCTEKPCNICRLEGNHVVIIGIFLFEEYGVFPVIIKPFFLDIAEKTYVSIPVNPCKHLQCTFNNMISIVGQLSAVRENFRYDGNSA